jgi:hypothetical protein
MSQYDKTTRDGETITYRTKKWLDHCELIFRVLGGKGDIQCVQGEWQPASDNSALTHTRNGPVDLYVTSGQYRLLEKAHRCGGGGGWDRLPTSAWREHFHGFAMGTRDMHEQARRQAQDYTLGLNGFSDHSADTSKAWRPPVILNFRYAIGWVDLDSLRVEATKSGKWRETWSVKQHQHALNAKTNAHLTVDGIYGEMTKAATKRWEGINGWERDGIPGILSETMLQGALNNVRG